MKKWVLALAFMLLSMPVFAGQIQETVIDTTTLGKTNATTNGQTATSEAKRVSFFVTYDSSDTTTGVTVTVSAKVSYDGTHWADACWYDTAGGVTPQTSETLSSDGTYVMWMPPAPVRLIKITTTMDNAAVYGSGDTGAVTVTVIKDE